MGWGELAGGHLFRFLRFLASEVWCQESTPIGRHKKQLAWQELLLRSSSVHCPASFGFNFSGRVEAWPVPHRSPAACATAASRVNRAMAVLPERHWIVTDVSQHSQPGAEMAHSLGHVVWCPRAISCRGEPHLRVFPFTEVHKWLASKNHENSRFWGVGSWCWHYSKTGSWIWSRSHLNLCEGYSRRGRWAKRGSGIGAPSTWCMAFQWVRHRFKSGQCLTRFETMWNPSWFMVRWGKCRAAAGAAVPFSVACLSHHKHLIHRKDLLKIAHPVPLEERRSKYIYVYLFGWSHIHQTWPSFRTQGYRKLSLKKRRRHMGTHGSALASISGSSQTLQLLERFIQ